MKNTHWLRRLVSYIIDSMITAVFLIPFWVWFVRGLFSSQSGNYLLGYSMIIPFLWGFVQLLYMTILWSTIGATAGMALLHCRVLTGTDQRRVSFFRALLRYLGMILNTLLFGLGFIPCLFGRERRALQDRISSTRIFNS